MIKVFACFLLGCVVLTFGARRERIAFARKVTESEFKEEFPFMVYVRVCDWYSLHTECNFCSGTLVKPDQVIMAAHCFCRRGNFPSTTVHSSSLKYGSSKASATAARRMINMPDSYCGTGKSIYPHVGRDIALIGLMQKLDVPTVPLFCKRNGWWTVVFLVNGKRMVVKFRHLAVPMGTKVWMIGFGYNEKKVLGTLRIATGRTVECPHRYNGQPVFCVASAAGKPAILSGDSGGPLLIKRGGKFFQIGVASAGKNFKDIYRRFKYNVFVDVHVYCKAISNASK